MSPELITAIKERLAANQTRQEIESAVLAMGHTKEVFTAAFTLAEHDIKEGGAGSLPKARTLFKNAWGFAQSRPDLIAILFIPLVLETLGLFWFDKLPESERFSNIPLMLLFVLIGIAYVVTIATALRVVSASNEEDKTLAMAVTWMKKNALPLLWVYVLSGLVIFGGFLFFIIPGIVVAVSLTFAQYVFASEGKGGMQALLASRELVRGRWWKVVRKIFGFIILTLIPLFLIGILYGIVLEFTGEGAYVTLGGDIIIQVVSAVMSLMSLHAMYHLYQALKAGKEGDTVPSTHTRVRYWLLIAISLVVTAVVAVLAAFFSEKLDWLEEAAAPLEEMESRDVPSILKGLNVVAVQYAWEHNGSLDGVCDKLRPFAESEGEVTCNDSETAWALQVVDDFGDKFCADTATPGKKIEVELGEKTECIAVGG